ncbi:hypothetical protein F5X71_34805 [Nocardia brasiliensis]|uniref:Uncharacterized protein n=1 Tax=Nocardia brasiliensis TaxID=37326 RepID=A0A6G9Y103_NOCBR|nr:hypothetical protein [Nocardia brasiliensis]QIS06796.1 hypothetical protein F5X71_34805 [Nocardia brasiliensis]
MSVILGTVTEVQHGPDGRITIEATITGEDVLAFLPGHQVGVHLHYEPPLDAPTQQGMTNAPQ